METTTTTTQFSSTEKLNNKNVGSSYRKYMRTLPDLSDCWTKYVTSIVPTWQFLMGHLKNLYCKIRLTSCTLIPHII